MACFAMELDCTRALPGRKMGTLHEAGTKYPTRYENQMAAAVTRIEPSTGTS